MKNPERPTAPPMATKIGYTCERARKRVWSVDRFIHSFPGHHAGDASRRNDGSRDRGKEGTNETFPGPTAVRISHDERTIGARSVVRSRRTLLLDPFTREEDATNDGRRTTTHLWAKPTLSERHVESKRVFVLWRIVGESVATRVRLCRARGRPTRSFESEAWARGGTPRV